MGSASWPLKSSTDRPASPVSTARETVCATPSGSSAKPFSRSAETGRSVAATIAAACARASSRLTEPSERPSVTANPELVVASAWKPNEASSFADPWSHGFGSSSGFPGRCSSRNLAAFSVWVVMASKIPRGSRAAVAATRRAEPAHLSLAAAPAAGAPARLAAARVPLAAVAPRAAADRVALHIEPPEAGRGQGDDHYDPHRYSPEHSHVV